MLDDSELLAFLRKGRNNQLEELKCDMTELIQLLKQATRQSMKEVILIEINTIT
jgi:hypothetical protein